MSENDVLIGTRIAALRTAAGLRQADIAEVLGLDPSTVSKIESGRRRLDGYELAVVADLLGTTSRELLGLPTRTAVVAAAARAAGNRPEPALRRARELLEADGIVDQLGLSDRAQPRRLEPPEGNTHQAITKLAQQVRAQFKVGPQGTIADLSGAIEDTFGLDVAVDPLGDRGPAGVLVQSGDDVALVVLNGDDRRTRQRFTLAHELGHWLLGDVRPVIVDNHVDSTDQAEMRANRFAADLLMPEEALGDLFSRRQPVEAFVAALITLGVSKEALLIRLANLDLLDGAAIAIIESSAVRHLFAQAGRSSDFDEWETGSSSRVPSRIDRRLRAAYASGKVGIGLMAQAFGDDVETLTRRFATEGLAPPAFDVDDDTLAAL